MRKLSRSSRSVVAKHKDGLMTRIERVDDHLIGLWRFRKPREPVFWCATFHFDGMYYDVSGANTPHSALDAVWNELELLRSREVG